MDLNISSVSSTAVLKKNNCRSVYHAIYSSGFSTKQGLASALNLSLPTITHILQDLTDRGLIGLSGHSDSTGGRRPSNIRIIPDACVAAGLEILKEFVRLIVVDLYGKPLFEKTLTLDFHKTSRYFDTVCSWANELIHSLPYPQEHVLGIGIALQGLLSPDGKELLFAHQLEPGVTVDDFASRLDWPCSIIHDAELAATAEMWGPDGLKNAFFLSLNRNMGSAVISGGKVLTGSQNFSSTIEHMELIPDGKPCYCGKCGCVEAYCSANALSEESGLALPDFFARVRSGMDAETRIWHCYLKNLARVIDNIRMVFRCDILIGGLIQTYMLPEDISHIISLASGMTFYKADDLHIRPSRYGEKATAIGGGLTWIKPFLDNI